MSQKQKAYVYSLRDGEFTGRTLIGDMSILRHHVVVGEALYEHAWDSELDWRRKRVNLETGKLASRKPARPADTEDTQYKWDKQADDWIAEPTRSKLVRDAKAKRDELLKASDWVTLRSADTGQPIPPEWSAYRAALRDITTQSGYPTTIEWPEAPT